MQAPVPAQLAFQLQPVAAEPNLAMSLPVKVAVQDASGRTVTSATSAVTLALGSNPTSAALSGVTTVNAVGGVATFTDLRLDRFGTGYTLVATPATLTGATSQAFMVVRFFTRVSTEYRHACAVTPGGAAYCWGDNTWGELGDGTTTLHTRPVAVAGGLTFADVSAGSDYTCGLTTPGAAYCWGMNDRAQLGDGSMMTQASPVPVAG